MKRSIGTCAVTAVALAISGSASAATWERSLGLEHARNFRDVGGYRTSDGHWVRAGVAYRSGALGDLDAQEWSTVTGKGVNLDVDLRNISERRDKPDNQPASVAYDVADVVNIPGTVPITFKDCTGSTPLNSIAALAQITKDDVKSAATAASYPLMVCYSGAEAAYHELFTQLADHDSGAIVFHCSAGKDRTGWAAAVLLTILGVPRDSVNADFMASNTYRGPGSVQQPWLDAAFRQVHDSFGTFDNYVRHGLKLDATTVAKLRARFLTDGPPAA